MLFVIDTNSLISFFQPVFGRPSLLSPRAKHLMGRAFRTEPDDIKISIPSIVFVEIFDKWLRNEEFAYKFHYEVFEVIRQSPNIEIKPVEREVLDNLLKIGGILANHDLHDKVILASAMMLQSPLITSDRKIIEYVEQTHIIPEVLN